MYSETPRTNNLSRNDNTYFHTIPDKPPIPEFHIRNLTLVTQSGSGCGGYNVWIEINVGHQSCNTSVIDEFSAGNTLFWFGKYLGSCRKFNLDSNLDSIKFKIKTNSTDVFCPDYFYVFKEDATFKSEHMNAWHEVSKTNDKIHIARRTAGAFELPKNGKYQIPKHTYLR